MQDASITPERRNNPLLAATPEQLAELDRLHALSPDERLLDILDRLATDVGRLLRRISNGREVWTDLDVWTLERLAGHVESAYAFMQPTAAEIVAYTYPGDDDAITEALRIVDARTRALHVKLGLDAANAMRTRAWREQLAEELAA